MTVHDGGKPPEPGPTEIPFDAFATTAGDPTAKPPPASALIPGYELLGELGRGGMGVVYKARHLALNRMVALKMVLSGSHAGSEDIERFRDEAAAVARVQHPNLVQIFEVGEHEGRPYFALEYIDGESFDHWRRTHNPRPHEAARMVEILARAIHAVHLHHMVHRDLKPGNILLTKSGVPKITDFGLVKHLGSGEGRTATGDILGTPAYMAPEQATGRIKQIGPGTDIYALGAILYELLTGQPPFLGATGLEIVLRVAREEPRLPSQIRTQIPRDLETICLKCLEKQPAKRYHTAEDLAEDLRRFQAGEPIKARPIGALGRTYKWAQRHPAWATVLTLAAVALVVLAVVGTLYNLRLQNALDEARDKTEESRQRLVRLNVATGAGLLDGDDWFSALLYFAEALRLDPGNEDMHRLRIGCVLKLCPEVKQMWFHEGAVREVQFSPNGKFVVTASDDHTARVRDVNSGQNVGKALRHDGPVVYAEFSADGQWVVTASTDGSARVWSAATGEARTPPLLQGAPLQHATFSPDGLRVATCGDNKVVILWNAVTGQPLPPQPHHQESINTVAFSPDGQWLATASNDRTARIWNSTTGAEIHSLAHAGRVLWLAFHPQGESLVTACSDGIAQLWDVKTGQRLGQAMMHRAAIVYVAFSSDGKSVATASEDRSARVWDARTGKALSPLLRHHSKVNRAVFSPNCLWLATAGDDNAQRLWCLVSFEEYLPALYYHGSVSAVRFSPQGDTVLSGAFGGLARLTGARADLLELMTERQKHHDNPAQASQFAQVKALSGDGKRMLKVNDKSSARLFEVATGNALTPPLQHASKIMHVAFSPDETRLLTCSDDNSVCLWNATTGELQTRPLKHLATVVFAAFSPDGRLVVTCSQDETARVWDAATGEPITPPLIHAATVTSATFAENGLTIKTLDTGGRQMTWKLQRDDRPVDAIVRQARLLSCSRLDATRGLLPLDLASLRELYVTKE